MTTLTLRLPKLHKGQRTVVREACRFNVLCAGRRFGKGVVGLDRLIHTALNERLSTAWFSPTYKMLKAAWRDAIRLLGPVIVEKNVQEHRLGLLGGGSLDFWSLDKPDSARGRKYRRIVVDEAAMIRHLEEAWLEVIRPTLADYEGDAWFLSSPKGLNYFKTLCDFGQDPLQTEWMSWQMPTHTNPYIKRSEIESLKRSMTERAFTQEILAAFLADGTGVFRRVLEAATAIWQDEPIAGHQYVFGADWGRSNDYTVIAVKDVTEQSIVHLDRFTETGYDLQVGRLKALYDRFQPYCILAEQNSIGGPLIERLQSLDLPVTPFVTTNSSKNIVIEDLALAFEQSSLTIPNDSVLTSELLAYDMERLPSGLYRYNAPSGQHDDTVIATALAHHAGKDSGSLLLW